MFCFQRASVCRRAIRKFEELTKLNDEKLKIINIVSISRFRLTPTCCIGTYLSYDRVLQVGRSHRYIFCHMHLNIYVHFEKCQKTKHKKEEIFFFFSLSWICTTNTSSWKNGSNIVVVVSEGNLNLCSDILVDCSLLLFNGLTFWKESF